MHHVLARFLLTLKGLITRFKVNFQCTELAFNQQSGRPFGNHFIYQRYNYERIVCHVGNCVFCSVCVNKHTLFFILEILLYTEW